MSVDPLVGKVLADRFEIVERIGEGGYSVIYRANQMSFGVERPVAVKVLAAHVASDPEWEARFRSSARAFARVNHPNAVQVYDIGHTEDGFSFIAMEFAEGITLRREIDRHGALAPARALAIIGQAAHALAALHRASIIHRDMKPESILLTTSDGEPDVVKLLFSTVMRTRLADSPKTPVGRVLGSPWYMAPEQVRGEAIGPTADLYALGVVLYEALAGQRPFEGTDPIEVAVMQVRREPPPIPELPGIVGVILDRVLAKNPAARLLIRPAAGTMSPSSTRGLSMILPVVLLAVIAAAMLGTDPCAPELRV
mgnify:CR=1 FL=1